MYFTPKVVDNKLIAELELEGEDFEEGSKYHLIKQRSGVYVINKILSVVERVKVTAHLQKTWEDLFNNGIKDFKKDPSIGSVTTKYATTLYGYNVRGKCHIKYDDKYSGSIKVRISRSPSRRYVEFAVLWITEQNLQQELNNLMRRTKLSVNKLAKKLALDPVFYY